MQNAAEIIKNSGIAFGTSGARGLVVDFTSKVCAAFTLAFLGSDSNFKRVAIAIDNRPSSPEMAAYCIAAAKTLSINVDYYGVIPTPALAHTSMSDGIPSIMVTGSHIPFDRNGLKFYRPDGEITKADELAILNSSIYVPTVSIEVLPAILNKAKDAYIQRYLRLFPNDLLAGKKIAIYEHSSAGRDLFPKIFEGLGAEVLRLGRSDSFVAIDTEAVSDIDVKQAKKWQDEYQLDAIFSTDGDSDRPLLADEQGQYLRGDILGLLAAQFLQIEALSVPINCNSAIDSCGSFARVERTRIGSPYVIESFATLAKDYKYIAGFEANGGFLVGSDIDINGQLLTSLPTRDAVLPVLAVLALAGENTISSLLSLLPSSFTASDRLQNFAKEKSAFILEKAENEPALFLSQVGLSSLNVISTDKTDGLRIILDDNSVIHLRPSGNAPELRCYAEAKSQIAAQRLVKQILLGLNT